MRKSTLGGLALVVAGLCCGEAAAEEVDLGSAHATGTHVGLGVGLNLGGPRIAAPSGTSSTVQFAGGSIMVPIDVGGSIRFEPDFLFDHGSEADVITGPSGPFFANRKVTVLRPTLGIFGRVIPFDDVAMNIGARLGPGFTLIERSDDAMHVSVAPAFGAEYFVSSRFSIAAEAQLGFLFPVSDSEPEPDIATNAMLAARVFIFECSKSGAN